MLSIYWDRYNNIVSISAYLYTLHCHFHPLPTYAAKLHWRISPAVKTMMDPLPPQQETCQETQNSLSITDNRTGLSYNIPIARNSIRATDFHRIKSPHIAESPVDQNDAGIRIFDPGFQNTACMQSEITYVNGNTGEIAYRGIHLADLFYSGRPFEHIAYLLIFGHLPSTSESTAFNRSIATSEMPPQNVFDMINNLP